MEIVILFLYPSHEINASSAKLMYHKKHSFDIIGSIFQNTKYD